ncbi:MAG: hypothetical protein HRU20_28320 [Pseudomonadales bacterium]|nr:hypothetical protein [Pseudomonadales bacterium]
MSQIQRILNNTVLRILKPLVRVLLRHGVSHAEFSELAKLAYVDVAENDFRIAGRKQSVARVCVLTGMHRKDVNNIRERLENDDFAVEQLSRAARVISGWTQDADFIDNAGNPLTLPMEAEFGFNQLVKRYSGDMPVRAILDELRQSGSISVNKDNEIELINTAYVPHQSDEKLLQILGISTADLLNTIDHNLNCVSDDQSRLQLVVDYKNISDEKAERFKLYSEREVFKTLKKLNKWFTENNQASDDNENKKRIGFGLYYFEGDVEKLSKENHEE